MNIDEELALRYLTSLGLGEIVYEADGNVPPDFVVDGRVAVEVRRLNYNHVDELGSHGLEEDQLPLFHTLKKVAAAVGPPTAGATWFVTYSFRRPLEPLPKIAEKVRSILEGVRDGSFQGAEFPVTARFTISLVRADEPHPQQFLIGGYSDYNAGGWVGQVMKENVQLCLEDKTRKISAVRSKYPVWWLVLVDHIDFAQSNDIDVDKGIWDRVILVNPTDPTKGCDISRSPWIGHVVV
jgi:hypothetical protein